MQAFGYTALEDTKQINGKTSSDRVAEGDAILASVFGEVAVAA
jgi:hypothetical protein